MSADQLLSELRSLDIRLFVDGGRLRCSAPKGRLTSDLSRRIAEHKEEILRMLPAAVSGSGSDAIPSRPASGAAPPLSFAQERFWFLQKFDPGSTAYNITACRPIFARLDVARLEAALKAVFARHEILRTNFPEVDGVANQLIHPEATPELDVYNLEHLAGRDLDAEIESLVQRLSRQTFDLTRDLLLRAAVIRVAEEQHVIALTMHHIVCDGWSLGILFDELRVCYEAQERGSADAVPPLPIQYADYALWERNGLTAGTVATQMEYWKNKLRGAPPYLDFPLDRPRPASASSESGLHRFQLDAATSQAVQRFARQHGATLFVSLLAIFKALLFRYTRQSDILIGTPVSSRTRPELERLVGCFINPRVLRTEISAEMTATDLLGSVRATVVESLNNADIPFEQLVNALITERDLSRSPLYQVAFILQNTPHASEYGVVSGGSALDLTLYMWESGGSIGGSVEYRADLFKPETISRFAGCFATLAAQMTEQPDAPIGHLTLLTSAQLAECFAKDCGVALAYPHDLCTHEWVERQAAQTPYATAVMCGDERLTYRELSLRSNRLAHRLRALGVGPESLVAICLDRSIDLVVAPLAVWKAGGAYVPLDPEYPSPRLAFMLEDSAAAVLVTESRFLKQLPSTTPHVLCLDQDRALLERESHDPLTPSATAEDLAYVIYTSGSTGKPKGVEIRHRSLVNFLSSMQTEPGMRRQDRLLAVTTLSFDIAGLELYLPLVSGAEVVIAPRAAAFDGAALAKILSQSAITIMQATPVTWRLLLESGWRGTPGLKILCGGEALSRDVAERLLATGAEVWNLYGPTETTIWSTLHRVERGSGRVPIGHPIANTQVYVLDEYGQPVPAGVAGELYIGGDGLARGYLRRPELTAERFAADPFHPGERLYRTGDLARNLTDGTLECLGRLDQQIKVRGFRVELGEIETALGRCAGVSEAAVVLREDVPGDQRLVAYLIPLGAAQLSPQDLRAQLVKTLPDHMIPSAFVVRKAFPLTPNRKIDRRALPPPDIERLPAISRVPPSTETQKIIAHIWTELLNQDGFGIQDSFFELGGHSLLLIQLQSRLRSRIGREIPMSQIFREPTIAAMAAFLDTPPSDGAHSGVEGEVVRPVPVRGQHDNLTGCNFIETQLLAIWQRVLGLHGIGMHDNFFELGGQSESVVSLFSQMEKVFGALPVSLLSEGPTVGQMARKLADLGIPRSPRSLIAIQALGDRPPLFVVPGGIGSPLTSTNFALNLPLTQPVYGLQFVGLEGRRPALERVGEIASHFISEIRSLRKEGPYHLAGHCLGGVIAFEMAQQLVARGHEVATLILIDTFPPSVYHTDQNESISMVRRAPAAFVKAARRLRTLWGLSGAETAAYFRRKFGAFVPLGSRREMSQELSSGDVGNRMWEANIKAIKRYRPKSYKGPIVLIVCDGGGLQNSDPRLQWMALSGSGSEIHRLNVPNHDQLVDKPWVEIVAEDLRKTFEDRDVIIGQGGRSTFSLPVPNPKQWSIAPRDRPRPGNS